MVFTTGPYVLGPSIMVQIVMRVPSWISPILGTMIKANSRMVLGTPLDIPDGVCCSTPN